MICSKCGCYKHLTRDCTRDEVKDQQESAQVARRETTVVGVATNVEIPEK